MILPPGKQRELATIVPKRMRENEILREKVALKEQELQVALPRLESFAFQAVLELLTLSLLYPCSILTLSLFYPHSIPACKWMAGIFGIFGRNG